MTQTAPTDGMDAATNISNEHEEITGNSQVDESEHNPTHRPVKKWPIKSPVPAS